MSLNLDMVDFFVALVSKFFTWLMDLTVFLFSYLNHLKVGQDSVSTEEAFGSITRFSNPTFVDYRRSYLFLLASFLTWHPC